MPAVGSQIGELYRKRALSPVEARDACLAHNQARDPTFIAFLTGQAAIVTVEDGRFVFTDRIGEVRDARQRLAPRGMVTGGRWWPDL